MEDFHEEQEAQVEADHQEASGGGRDTGVRQDDRPSTAGFGDQRTDVSSLAESIRRPESREPLLYVGVSRGSRNATICRHVGHISLSFVSLAPATRIKTVCTRF